MAQHDPLSIRTSFRGLWSRCASAPLGRDLFQVFTRDSSGNASSPGAEALRSRLSSGAVVAVAVSSILSLWVTPSAGQTLDEVRQAIGEAEPSPPPAKPDKSSEKKKRRDERRRQQAGFYFDDPNDDDDEPGQQLANAGWELAGAITFAVFIGDPNSNGFDINYEIEPAEPTGIPANPPAPTGSQSFYFAHYPYADGFDGYTMESSHVPARPLTAATQVQVSYGSDFDSIDWYTGKGLFEWSRSRFGLDTEWTYFSENRGNGTRDELHVGDVNLMWRRIQGQKFLLRWGLGAVWSHDSTATDVGLNGTIKFDYFPRKPFIISGEYDIGKLGSATAQHLQLGVGATWNHLELFSAYDYRRFDQVDISGPVFGMRFWW